jgi:hypothetical protein
LRNENWREKLARKKWREKIGAKKINAKKLARKNWREKIGAKKINAKKLARNNFLAGKEPKLTLNALKIMNVKKLIVLNFFTATTPNNYCPKSQTILLLHIFCHANLCT